MIELGKNLPFTEFLANTQLIKTPNEIYALPVGTILEPRKFGGLDCYDCLLFLGKTSVFLDSKRKTPKKDELAIVYRGPPSLLRYHPSFGIHKVVFNPNIEVTVLGYSLRNGVSRMYIGNWAFVDHISKK